MESIKPSNHLICLPRLLLPSTFPSIREMAGDGNFPVNWLFTSGGQSIGASASVLLMKIQGWFPLGLTGLISLLSKGLSRVFQHQSSKASSLPAPQFESINSSALSLLYSPTFTSIYDYWKNHRFDCMDLCWPRASLKRKCFIMEAVTSPGWFFFLSYAFVISSVFLQ